jgi:hypothetical protein
VIQLRPYESAAKRCPIPLGQISEYMTVLEQAPSQNGRRWRVRCKCGAESVVWTSQINAVLKRGRPGSCGCAISRYDSTGRQKCYTCKQRLPHEAFSKNQEVCKACAKLWRENNRATLARLRADYVRRNGAEIRARARIRARANKAAANVRSARWRARHPEKRRQVALEWTKRNTDYMCFIANRRRARKIMATPAWADEAAIRTMYQRARRYKLTVDHIVPLVSKIVCGLHWEANLQLLASRDNISKSNRHWPDMP